MLSQYLLFHFGRPEDRMPWPDGPRQPHNFPVQIVRELLSPELLPPAARALDVGCAVGGSAFELARSCASVIGVDFSDNFIRTARRLASGERIPFALQTEGMRQEMRDAQAPPDTPLDRVTFETGDATALRADLGCFHVVLAANLLCRLPDPAAFLARLPDLVAPGGQLILTTPCSWLEEYTPREKWLATEFESTSDALHRILAPHFRLDLEREIPFVIREHSRKFQWSVAQGTRWVRSNRIGNA